jgi:phage I-like protein
LPPVEATALDRVQQIDAEAAAAPPGADLAALQAERAADLEGEVSALKNAIEAEKREQLIAKLSADGKLPPSQQAWAREQTLANLESFARCAPVVVQAEAPKERAPENGALTLSDEERRIASIFGHSEEELLKSKRLLAEGKVV